MSTVDDLTLMDEWGPEKIVCVSDTRTGMRGVLVVDNTARGIGKGGTRMTPTVTMPREYVFGLDMGLTENDAAIIQDEVGDRGAAVGTPRELGGVPYDDWGVTGYGVAEAADAALEHRGETLRDARVVIQGFGAVGAAAARRLTELGAAVVAVSTAHGALHDPDGLDVDTLLAAREEHGDALVDRIAGRTGRRLDAGAEFLLDANVLVPAATQDVVDVALAPDLRFDVIVEGANLPITPEAQELLAARGVTVVPDFIANAGGVVAAAYAMDARRSPFPTEPAVIFAAVSQKMRTNTAVVLGEAANSGETSHAAARRLAADRVRTAMRLKRRTREQVAA